MEEVPVFVFVTGSNKEARTLLILLMLLLGVQKQQGIHTHPNISELEESNKMEDKCIQIVLFA
jgi:uncharacterized membrane protein